MTTKCNQVILGDCMDILPTMESNSIHLVVTDPPYSIPNNNNRPDARLTQRKFSDFSATQFYFKQFLNEINRVLKDDGRIYLFCDEKFYAVLYPIFYEMFYYVKVITWDKLKIGLGGVWRNQSEFIIYASKKPQPRNSGDGDIIKCKPVPHTERIHNSQKPIELLKKLILKSSNEYDVVLDPFLGSGSTVIACKQINRNYLGIEVNDDMYEKATSQIGNYQEVLNQ